MNTKNFLELLVKLYAEQEKIKVRYFISEKVSNVSNRKPSSNKIIVKKPDAV